MMARKTELTEELEKSYAKLLQSIPMELRDDENIKACLMVYLKLGGEKLAKQNVEIVKQQFSEEIDLIKRYFRIEAEENDSDEDDIDEDSDDQDEDESLDD